MRRLWLVVALLAAGCGGTVSRHAAAPAAPVVPTAPPPPIAAIDEPATDEVSWNWDTSDWDNAGDGTIAYACGRMYTVTPSADPPAEPLQHTDDCKPTPEELAQLKAEAQQQADAVRPAAGSEPRAVAKLTLGPDASARFVVWWNRDHALCTDVVEDDPDGGGDDGVGGPCNPDSAPCGAICLDSNGGSSADGPMTYLLAGSVDTAAAAIRVTVAGGASDVYPLTGPRVPGTDRRVFMFALGTLDWRRLELIRDGRVVATSEMDAFQVAVEECQTKLGEMPTPASLDDDPGVNSLDLQNDPVVKRWDDEYEACLRAALPDWPDSATP